MATFFATVDEFAAWLERHGAGQTEFVVGYYKRGSKRPSMTGPSRWTRHCVSGGSMACASASMSTRIRSALRPESPHRSGAASTLNEHASCSAKGKCARPACKPCRVAAKINRESIPTSSERPPHWNAAMNCDFEKPRRRGNSSQHSRAATGSWSFGGLSVQNVRRRESAACKS